METSDFNQITWNCEDWSVWTYYVHILETFIYYTFFLILERENISRGEGQEKRERESQGGSALSVDFTPPSLTPRPWDRDLSQNQELGTQPTEPQAPHYNFLLFLFLLWFLTFVGLIQMLGVVFPFFFFFQQFAIYISYFYSSVISLEFFFSRRKKTVLFPMICDCQLIITLSCPCVVVVIVTFSFN